MKTSDILSADILDVLFDGKNKSYGAYDLRKTYTRRLNLALAGTAFLCLLFVAGTIFANTKKTRTIETGPIVVLSALPEKQKELPPPPPPPKQPEPKVAVASFTPPLITPDDKVPPEDIVKDMDDLQTIKIGNADVEGVIDDKIAPPVEKTPASTEIKKTDDIENGFIPVQIAAEFVGGAEAWRKYLQRNLNNELPVDNGAPQGKYTVTVSFIVDRNGVISDVKAENDPGYGTKAEAIRVITKGPDWKPAQQNGHPVIYRHKQSITFTVAEP